MKQVVNNGFIWLSILPIISAAGICSAQTLPDDAIMRLGRGSIGDVKYSPDSRFIAMEQGF
jgi:hypothetical protein